MNKIYLFLCLLLSALLTACYEDKGNYDYHPVNEIQFLISGKNISGRGGNIFRSNLN